MILAKSEGADYDEIRGRSLNHAQVILEALYDDTTHLSSLFRYSFNGSLRDLYWKSSTVSDAKIQLDIKVFELFQQVLVAQAQQSLIEQNRVDNISDSSPLAEALTISEYTRTFAIDFQLVENYKTLMREVFDAMSHGEPIDPEDDARLSRASNVFSQFRPPSVHSIRDITKNDDATLVFYSLISNVDTSLPRQLYIWVVEPSGQISFVSQASVEEFQGNASNLSSLRRYNCERSSEALSDICRSVVIEMAEEGVRGARESLGVTDRNHQALRFADQSREQDEVLKSLYQLLIAPIENHLPIANPEAKVIFIPEGSLNFIPFSALKNPDGGNYLIQDHTIVTVPNIRTLNSSLDRDEYQWQEDSWQEDSWQGDSWQGDSWQRGPRQRDRWHDAQGNHNTRKALVIGNPEPMPDSLVVLPGAEKETYGVANLLNSEGFEVDRYTRNQATKQRVIEKMQDGATIIHLATHGIIDAGSNRSGSWGSVAGSTEASGSIALAGEYLDASEIFNINLPDTDLVVLSACNTGVAPLVPGGVIGLPFSFRAAGAPSVLMSLWDIPDAQTAELMNDFYKYWFDRSNKAQALRLAMLDMIEKYPNSPRYWAAFTLVGADE